MSLVLLLAFSVSPCAYAGIPSSWLGKYEGMATACRGDELIVEEDAVTTQSCKYSVKEIILANEKELTLVLSPGNSCRARETVVTLKKPSGTAVDLYNYRSAENYKKKYSPNRCGYAPRMK